MNPLVIYLQPKDGLGHIRNQLLNVPCDKLILKYYPYPDVYNIALKTIKEHPEYSHIIWVQNDINFNKDAYFKLIKGLAAWKLEILGASMNVDLSPRGMKFLAYSVQPFEIHPTSHIPFTEKGRHKGLVKVFHNGGVFACTREFYLKFPLTGKGKAGYNADIQHGQDIRDAGIKYFVDNEIFLKHERYMGINKVGVKEPEVEVIRY